MNEATLTVERPEPQRRPKLIADGVMGMLLFVFTEVMMFSGLISAHVIVKSQAIGQLWPPLGQPRLPFEETAINTAALLVSGLVLGFAHFAYKKRPAQALVPLAVSVLLGLFFVGFQGVEWVGLIREGLTMTSHPYGAFFYLIVGAHALHAVAAIACLGWAWNRLRRGTLNKDQFVTVQIFWYFVVLLWPFLYVQVYL
ncbi:MAG: heme-copper oxidase subunit III [Gemmatimonadetes bacterium]|nr:heme-copper oxidase subunit III [Gemmatimonadota bacterium]